MKMLWLQLNRFNVLYNMTILWSDCLYINVLSSMTILGTANILMVMVIIVFFMLEHMVV